MLQTGRDGRGASPTLTCPICRSTLEAAAHALRCTQGHAFDRAREGYYNLLVVQHKASLDPGDSKEMVGARRRVLDAGFYAPMAARTCEIARRLVEAMDRPADPFILDAGCGEGYYLDAIATSSLGKVKFAGIDISKWAIRAAAKRNPHVLWAVASNRHLPFASASVDLILSMFGFPLWDAFAAVQPSGAGMLLVDPGPDHLIELRSIIYPTVNATAPQPLDAALGHGYRVEDEQRLRFRFDLSSAKQIADLLAMTPHAHRAPQAGREALAKLSHLALTGDAVFRTLRRG